MRVAMLQATFKSIPEEQQHLAGPTHRKALIRQQAEQELKSRIANSRDAAHSAVVSGAASYALVARLCNMYEMKRS